MRRYLALAAVVTALACSDKKPDPPVPVVAASSIPTTMPAEAPAAEAAPPDPAHEAPAAPPGPNDYKPGFLPKDFPLPLPEGAVVVGGQEMPVAEGVSYNVTITTKVARKAAVAFYEKAFKAKKLTTEKVDEVVLGGAMTSLMGRSPTATASALITEEADGTKVALSWQPDGIPVRHAPGQQPKSN